MGSSTKNPSTCLRRFRRAEWATGMHSHSPSSAWLQLESGCLPWEWRVVSSEGQSLQRKNISLRGSRCQSQQRLTLLSGMGPTSREPRDRGRVGPMPSAPTAPTTTHPREDGFCAVCGFVFLVLL